MIKEKKDYRALIQSLGVISVVPTGNSMLPFIRGGKDVVVVEKPTRPLKELDAVLYQTEQGDYILHRIVKITSSGYIAVGDNLALAEEINEQAVIGVLTAVYKGKRKIEANDISYIKKIEKWYKNPKRTQAKRKRMAFWLKVKTKVKRCFEK